MVPIVISDSDTDGEGDVQITSSSRARASTSRNSPQASSSAQGHTSASAPPPARSGLASLIPDRAALEAERLARAQKRNRELEQDVSAPSGSSAIGSDTEQAGKRLRTDATPIRGTGGGIRTGTSSGNNDFGGSLGRRDDVKDAGSTRYWDGVTRVSEILTLARGCNHRCRYCLDWPSEPSICVPLRSLITFTRAPARKKQPRFVLPMFCYQPPARTPGGYATRCLQHIVSTILGYARSFRQGRTRLL